MSSSEFKVVNVDFMHEFTDKEMENGNAVKRVLMTHAAQQIAYHIIEQGLGEVEKQYDWMRQTTKFNTRVRVLVKK